ncbi:anthranilate synthase component I family protein [Phenylobacterium sp.]|jgi:para-aminobenzoate synthetase component 1|uniref:anthranilate synthase component I family protein n=1 Tax=Phenylobacterium sp. TaxID=1871053 RepID=UPI002F9431D9
MLATALLEAVWRDPAETLGALADEPWAIGFLSGGTDAGWSYVAAAPDATLTLAADDRRDPFAALKEMVGEPTSGAPDGPPFQGGVAGLASYDLGDRVERLGLGRLDDWPDLACGRYPSVLAFDHRRRRSIAVGRGADPAAARRAAETALAWLALPARQAAPPAADLSPDDPAVYEAAVAEVVGRIHAGEIFQANIARRWRGRLAQGAAPADVLANLAARSPAPFASYLRLPGRAVVSNSPERFLRVVPCDGRLTAETQPIKGTAPRGRSEAEDRALAEALAASPKDRAENLMIVDLMRNDLARVCSAGSVRTPELFRLVSFANVHHLVSTVTGLLAPGRTAVDLLQASFPPGSITGAPKVQAMKVISQLEPPRGPFFGAMFQLGFDGMLDSSVLIRTAGFVQEGDRPGATWRVEARAGAGIVADSDPRQERQETESKISAMAAALGAA